jgi:hypothetical protein
MKHLKNSGIVAKENTMKQKHTKQLRERLASTLCALEYEIERLHVNLAVLHMLNEKMEETGADRSYVNVVQSVRLAMIDCLSNLETEGSEIYNAIDNTSEEGTK